MTVIIQCMWSPQCHGPQPYITRPGCRAQRWWTWFPIDPDFGGWNAGGLRALGRDCVFSWNESIYIYIYWRVCKDFYRFHPQQVLTLLYSVYGTKEVSHMCERPWWDMGDSTWENTLMTFKVCFLQCNVSPWRQQSHNFVLLVIAWERNRMRRRGLSVLQ